jgi:hypothetical protein
MDSVEVEHSSAGTTVTMARSLNAASRAPT